MEFTVLTDLMKKYGPGVGLAVVLGYIFFKTLVYIVDTFKKQTTDLTDAYMKGAEAQRTAHKATLDTMTTTHKEVTTNALDMMKMTQKYSESMLKQISDHNLSVHKALDTRVTGVENELGKVSKAINDLSEKIILTVKG